MKIGLASTMYNEERFVKPFLKHLPKWLDEVLILVSQTPWQGESELPDKTDIIAREMGASVVINNWPTEHEQRNAGQEYFSDFDWVLWLDPDEYILRDQWGKLFHILKARATFNAYVAGDQITYYKDGIIEPHEEYKQLIAARPEARFYDKRCIDVPWGYAPITLHHMSWRRPDKEIWKKITHYSHADEFDKEKWYKDIWLKDVRENVHPLTPEALRKVVPHKMPRELKDLGL